MKKRHIFIISCLLFLAPLFSYSHAYPRIKGFYLGALIGVTWADYSDYSFPADEVPNKIIDVGAGPQYTFGYGFNPIAALELGAVYLRKPKFKNLHNSPTTARFKNNVVYLTMRLSYFLNQKLRLFAKAGVGYVVRDNVIDQGVLLVRGKAVVVPVYGVGLDYRVASHWELELAWLQAAPSSGNKLPASNILGVGAHYLFL